MPVKTPLELNVVESLSHYVAYSIPVTVEKYLSAGVFSGVILHVFGNLVQGGFRTTGKPLYNYCFQADKNVVVV